MDVPEIAIPPRGRKVIPITDPTTGEVINARDVEQAEAAAVPLPETCCSSPHSDMETTGSNYTQVLDSLPPLSFGSQPSTPSNGVLLPAFAGQSLYQAPLPHFVGQHSPSAALPPLAGQQYYSIPSIPCFGQYSYGPPILQFPNQPVPIAPYPGIQPQVVHYTTQINMTPGSELAVFNDWNSPYAGGEYSPFQTMPSHPELQNRLICENNRLVQDAQNRDAQLRQLLTGPHPMHPHGSHVPAANQCGFSERWVARRRAPTQSPWTFKNEWERQQWQAHCERVRCEANTYLHAIGRDLDQERLARLELQRSFEDDDEHLELEVFAVPCDGNEGLVPNGSTVSLEHSEDTEHGETTPSPEHSEDAELGDPTPSPDQNDNAEPSESTDPADQDEPTPPDEPSPVPIESGPQTSDPAPCELLCVRPLNRIMQIRKLSATKSGRPIVASC